MLGKVYINYGKDYDGFMGEFDFDALIEAVAISQNDLHVKITKDGEISNIIYEGRTKKYLAKESTRFIAQIKEVIGDENVASFVSKRQINQLRKVCNHGGRHLSCHALIILHIMYVNIYNTNNDDMRDKLLILAKMIHCLANRYLKGHELNALAQFLVDCYVPIETEFVSNRESDVGLFPFIPKRYV